MTIYSTALTGIFSARTGLSTTNNNIANANNPNFTRSEVRQSAALSTLTPSGFVGNGTIVTDINRKFDFALEKRIQGGISQLGYLSQYQSGLDRLDRLASDNSVNLNTYLDRFFNAAQDLSINPNTLSYRQALLTNADSLATQINSTAQSLAGFKEEINSQVSSKVQEINRITARISAINSAVVEAKAANPSSQPPSGLLDDRDALIQELSKIVEIKTVNSNRIIETSDGAGIENVGIVNIFLKNGQALVQDTTTRKVELRQSFDDPENFGLAIELNTKDGNKVVPLSAEALGSGELPALLTFRDKDLKDYEATLGHIAFALASEVNSITENSFDLNGQPGKPIFSFSGPVFSVTTSRGNDVSLTGSVVSFDINQARFTDFEVKEVNGSLIATPKGKNFPEIVGTPVGADQFDFGGQFVLQTNALNATPAMSYKDKLFVSLAGGAAKNLQTTGITSDQVAISKDPNQISDSTGAIELSELATKRTIALGNDNPSANASLQSLSNVYSTLVTRIGGRSVLIESQLSAKEQQLTQAFNDKASFSGVDLDQEAANLLRYQQAYQASAKTITVENELFNSFLAAFR